MTMRERIIQVLEPKCRGFGQGGMPRAIATEFADAVLAALETPTDYIGEVVADFVNTSMGRMTIDDGRALFTAAIRAAKDGK